MAKEKCDGKAIETAANLKGRGLTNKDVCTALGISEATFYRWVDTPKTDNQREFCEAVKKAEVEYKADLLDAIYSKATAPENMTWQAAAWLLERKYPKEFAKVSRMEIQDQDDREQEEAKKRADRQLRNEVAEESDEELRENIRKAARTMGFKIVDEFQGVA